MASRSVRLNRETRAVRQQYREAVEAARPGQVSVTLWVPLGRARALVKLLDRIEEADRG